MRAVDAVIRQRLQSDVVLINTISDYIIAAGGKRLRPALLLMMARALDYDGAYRHEMAAVIEFIHTATLLHDDVVDDSDLRRGRQTANAVFGNPASVLVGDLFTCVSDDGRAGANGHHACIGRRYQHYCRGRSAAIAELPRPGRG